MTAPRVGQYPDIRLTIGYIVFFIKQRMVKKGWNHFPLDLLFTTGAWLIQQ